MGLSGAKRRATGVAVRDGTLEAARRALPETIGEGEHQQPLMMGVLQAVRELAHDVQDLKMTAYNYWEGPVDWTYVKMALDYRREYGIACSNARGTSRKVGAVKNYLLAALYMAY